MDGMEDFWFYSRLEGRRWKEFCSLDLNFYLMILQSGAGQTGCRRLIVGGSSFCAIHGRNKASFITSLGSQNHSMTSVPLAGVSLA